MTMHKYTVEVATRPSNRHAWSVAWYEVRVRSVLDVEDAVQAFIARQPAGLEVTAWWDEEEEATPGELVYTGRHSTRGASAQRELDELRRRRCTLTREAVQS